MQPPPVHVAVQSGLPAQFWVQPPPSHVKLHSASAAQFWEQDPPTQLAVQFEPAPHCCEQPTPEHSKPHVSPLTQLQFPSTHCELQPNMKREKTNALNNDQM